MLSVKIPENSNGFFYIMKEGIMGELLSCYHYEANEVNAVVEIINAYNKSVYGKTIEPKEADIIKLDLLIRSKKSELKKMEDNLERLIKEKESV